MPQYLSELSSTNQFIISCKESRIEHPRSFYGCFYIGPFNSGQSLTVGNALRRTLLSELKGLAITKVLIEGAAHEYSNLPGIKDSVLDILLNLKEIVLKSNSSMKKPKIGYLQARGPGVVRAGDLKFPNSIQCVDPSQYIATICEDGILNMKFEINQGINYVLHTSQKTSTLQTPSKNITKQQHKNVLLIDAVFMPINKVNYVIESHKQYENQTANNIVILEIWTNGSIHPRKALYDAFKNLIRLFSQLEKVKIFNSVFLNSIFKSNNMYNKIIKNFHYNSNYEYNSNTIRIKKKIHTKPCAKAQEPSYNIPPAGNMKRPLLSNLFDKSNKKVKIINKLKQLESIDIGCLNISLRPYTCLKRANINTVYDLLKFSREELLQFKNFGKRSLEEVENSLQEIGVNLKNQ